MQPECIHRQQTAFISSQLRKTFMRRQKFPFLFLADAEFI